jgi:peptide/nickel transport system permease protein
MPVVLITDALVYLLLAAVAGFALYAARREHLRAPWRRVARSRLGVATAVVLSGYVLVGLADSIHYHPRLEGPAPGAQTRYSNETLSLLDWLTTPIRTRVEKTYSAPFATHLYARETVTLPGGGEVRIYPRLVYAGRHLSDPQRQRVADIVLSVVLGAVQGAVVWLGLSAALVAWLARRHGSGFSDQWRAVFRARTQVPWRVALSTLGVVLVVGLVAANLALKYHILGTDKVGEDVFYQALKSIRTGLLIGTLTTLVMLPFAVLLGIMAGYFRGWVDDLIQYLYTTLNSIPSVLLIAAAVLMLQIHMSSHAEAFDDLTRRADLRLLFLCLILGVTSWTGLCRLLRGEAFKLREMDYIQAATALGVGHLAIIVRHILPNVLHIVLITVVLDFSGLVLAEAVLSYIEIGVDPTTNSWGNMINSARLEMAREPVVWWSLVASLGFMFTLVLSANLFSDVVRDAFDPRLHGQGRP